MGIYHFAGLGRSAGAVTTGVSHLVRTFGNRHEEYGAMIEALVLFTSSEVADGTVAAFPTAHNEYGTTQTRRKWTEGKVNTVELVCEFMQREYPDAAVYLITVNINDYDDCFAAVGKATLNFHRPGSVGKHIWANITGGSNLLNAAIFQTASLSGMINRLYYTFVDNVHANGKFLHPFSTDPQQFRFGESFTIKTQFGVRHQRLLEVLEQVDGEVAGRYISGRELWARLKSLTPDEFDGLDQKALIRDFLNVMQGIERKGDRTVGQEDAVRLNAEGKRLLHFVRQPMCQALVQREMADEIVLQQILATLKIKQVR